MVVRGEADGDRESCAGSRDGDGDGDNSDTVFICVYNKNTLPVRVVTDLGTNVRTL